jgi:hypothetical protein
MIRHILTLAAMALAAFTAQAQNLKPAQLVTACAACKGAAACNTPRQIGDSVSVLTWLNAARVPAAPAWLVSGPAVEAEEAPSYTTYDSLAQGKRDSWMLFLRSPRDYTKSKVRLWVVDVWGAATGGSNAEAVLLAGTTSATNLQHALGGTTRSTGSVSALNLIYPGQASQDDANYVADPARCQG